MFVESEKSALPTICCSALVAKDVNAESVVVVDELFVDPLVLVADVAELELLSLESVTAVG